MELIAHRRNTIAELRDTPVQYGVEVDIRSQGSRLVIHHDAFVTGEFFEDWIEAYRHGTLILNVKEEGLEDALLGIVARRRIEKFFFLDQSFPFLMRYANRGERRCAVRVSEYESVDTALTLAGRIDWTWIDCFTRFPIDGAQARRLQQAGFRLCLVSPELQGRDAATGIKALRSLLTELAVTADAVCTKRPDLWEAS